MLVDRIAAGRAVAHVAAEMGASRQTGHWLLRRWRSRAGPVSKTAPTGRTAPPLAFPEARTRDRAHAPRPEAWTGAHRRPLRDARLDRPPAVPAWATHRPQQQVRASRPRRPATRRPEEAGVHAPRRRPARPGAGPRTTRPRRLGLIHSAVDDRSRLADSEILTDERAVTAVAFIGRARPVLRARRRYQVAALVVGVSPCVASDGRCPHGALAVVGRTVSVRGAQLSRFWAGAPSGASGPHAPGGETGCSLGSVRGAFATRARRWRPGWWWWASLLPPPPPWAPHSWRSSRHRSRTADAASSCLRSTSAVSAAASAARSSSAPSPASMTRRCEPPWRRCSRRCCHTTVSPWPTPTS